MKQLLPYVLEKSHVVKVHGVPFHLSGDHGVQESHRRSQNPRHTVQLLRLSEDYVNCAQELSNTTPIVSHEELRHAVCPQSQHGISSCDSQPFRQAPVSNTNTSVIDLPNTHHTIKLSILQDNPPLCVSSVQPCYCFACALVHSRMSGIQLRNDLAKINEEDAP